MNQRQIGELNALHRIQLLLDHHADALAGVNLAPLRQKLDQSISRLEMAGVEQAEAGPCSASLTEYKNKLRRVLRTRHLDPIITFATADISKMAAMSTFRVPSRSASDTELATVGRATAEAAAKCRDRYVELGMNPAFVEELEEVLEEFDHVRRARDSSRMSRNAATLGLAAEVPGAWQLVRMIRALIKHELGEGAAIVGALRLAARHAPRLTAPPEVRLLNAGTGEMPSTERAA